MDKLYYGSGTCSIESAKIVGLEIKYKGSIKITDKTSDNYAVMVNNKKILIFPVGKVEPLSDLFEYTGELKIATILASDINGKRVAVQVKSIMDYPELIDSKAEDITTNSESMGAGYLYKGRVISPTVDKKILKNLYTKGELYFEDGTPYIGAYHLHLGGGKAMTGPEHSELSEMLYIKKFETGKLVKSGTIKPIKRVTKRTARRTTKKGGYGGGGGGY